MTISHSRTQFSPGNLASVLPSKVTPRKYSEGRPVPGKSFPLEKNFSLPLPSFLFIPGFSPDFLLKKQFPLVYFMLLFPLKVFKGKTGSFFVRGKMENNSEKEESGGLLARPHPDR